MSTNPLLTVMIPNYNYAPYIAQAMESVAAQDYAPIELIVVDDASTDDSATVIRQTAEKLTNLARVETIILPENRGKLGAMNRALPEMKGDYLIILDSDDFLTPGYATRCIADLEAARQDDPKIGFVYTDCNLTAADGTYIDHGKSTAFLPELLEQYSFIPEPALCLTKIVTDAGPYDEAIRKGTKHHKWTRIVGNGWWGHYIPEPLFHYRMHACNLSSIGRRVLDEVDDGKRGERILSGYWPTQTNQEE